jgi:VWFA-related protein
MNFTARRSQIAAVSAALGLCVLNSPPAQSAAQRPDAGAQTPVITVGTRLVQVDVLVRDKIGPVTGLTRDDFTILDQGRRQEIAVFSSTADVRNAAAALTAATPAAPLPPGAVSNRVSPAGRPVAGATVILFDQLNTNFDNQAYAREGLLKYLQSLEGNEQVAIYTLGRNLKVLQNFTDDPNKLVQAVKKFDPKDLFVLIQSDELMDATDRKAADMSAKYYAQLRAQITSEAVAKIAQQLSGMPGRKSLVWLSDAPGGGGQFLRAANINLYPVRARTVGSSGVVAWMRDTREAGFGALPQPLPNGMELGMQRANAALAASMGGVAFNDAKDLTRAVQQAAEDAGNTYTLGFYPSADALDGKFHPITVNMASKAGAKKPALEIRYRPGYLAVANLRPVDPAAVAAASIKSLLESPLNATAIGLTAAITPAGPGSYLVSVTVDLHDLHLERQDGRFLGSIETSFMAEGSSALRSLNAKIQLTEDQLPSALQGGLVLKDSFMAEGQSPVLRIVVRDPATGALGSLRVPVNPQSYDPQN